MIRDLAGVEEKKARKEKETAEPKLKQVSAGQRDGQLCLFELPAERGNPVERSE